MSAMSELDLMLQEYEAARVRLTHAITIEAFHAAVDHVLRQGDVLANGLRSMLTATTAEPVGVVNPFKPGDIVEVGDWTKAYRQGKRRGRVLLIEDNLVEVGWPDNTAPTTFAFGDLGYPNREKGTS